MTPGDKVRYTGKWLRGTGQMTGRAGQERFVIQECNCRLCFSGNYVAVDRPNFYYEQGGFTEAEVAEDPSLKILHIARANLQKVRPR